MIIGNHEEFIGVKTQSVISIVDFEYFPNKFIVKFSEPFLSYKSSSVIQAQAP